MIKTNTIARVGIAALVAAGAVMAGCSDREDMTAGQKLDAAVASAQEEGRELQAEAREAGDAAQVQMNEAGNAMADAAIVAAVNAKLAADKDLEATAIDVAVNSGVVVLTGTAPTQAAAERAVVLAQGTDGVTSVTNELRIQGT